MSEFKGTYLEKLVDKKAEKDNSIDLNAYALGIEDSKASEMLEMLKRCADVFDNLHQPFISDDIKQLIKEATEL